MDDVSSGVALFRLRDTRSGCPEDWTTSFFLSHGGRAFDADPGEKRGPRKDVECCKVKITPAARRATTTRDVLRASYKVPLDGGKASLEDEDDVSSPRSLSDRPSGYQDVPEIEPRQSSGATAKRILSMIEGKCESQPIR